MSEVKTSLATKRSVCGLAAALIGIFGCGEDAGLVGESGIGDSVTGTVVLRFAFVPDGGDPLQQRRRLWGLAAALEERLSVASDLVPSESAASTVKLFSEDAVQLAWLDAASSILARSAVPGSRPLVRGLEGDFQLIARPELDAQFRDGFTDDLQEVLLGLPEDVVKAAFGQPGLVAASR